MCHVTKTQSASVARRPAIIKAVRLADAHAPVPSRGYSLTGFPSPANLLTVRHLPKNQHHSACNPPVFAIVTNGPLVAFRRSHVTLKTGARTTNLKRPHNPKRSRE